MDKKKLPNGGFPPIFFCLDKNKNNNKNNRLINSNIKNINIRQIINKNENNDLVIKKKQVEEIDIV